MKMAKKIFLMDLNLKHGVFTWWLMDLLALVSAGCVSIKGPSADGSHLHKPALWVEGIANTVLVFLC